VAGSSLLALIDDIATILDDVAVMSKVAVKKTAGVLGDDLALNAQQVTGVEPDRELPVVWAVAKGSLVNKAILVPAALAISALAPWAILPLLMLGGLFLCYEGFEKIAHKFTTDEAEEKRHHDELVQALSDPSVDLVALEKEKIKGAVRTDFILSAEIIVIALGTVATTTFANRVSVLVAIAVVMTIGVYGLVAGIVKLDDAGLYLERRQGTGAGVKAQRLLGRGLLKAAPLLLKFLSVAGMAAMFMVGGGILVHGIAPLHHWVEHVAAATETVPAVGGFLAVVTSAVLNGLAGVVAGALALIVVASAMKAWKAARPKASGAP
jgi:predicted DNA repair protein MutK